MPTHQSEYEDVAIGMDRNEVSYIKGTPFSGHYPTQQQKLIDQGKSKWDAFVATFIKTKELPKGLSINDAAYWTYELYDATLSIHFDGNDRVERVVCYSEKQYRFGCDSVSNIHIGSGEDEVRKVFGTPDSETIKYGRKTLRFDKYNVGFTLTCH